MPTIDYKSPEDIYRELFYDIHRKGIFEDGKLFADAEAKMHPDVILKTYLKEKNLLDFKLEDFVHKYFIIPHVEDRPLQDSKIPIDKHLSGLWSQLQRPPDKIKKNRSSKIPLPYSYIVPGGRFNEIYYWDSYFTMLGLQKCNQIEVIQGMVDNFKYLINTFGFIPNGNRSYFLSRSQPPFYSLMVKLLIIEKGQQIIKDYLPSLVKEYNFWMNGIEQSGDSGVPFERVMKLEKKYLLNRYYDHKDTPREEMFRDDWSMKKMDTDLHDPIYRQLRAACESGWDFSSRWLAGDNKLTSIRTTQLLPVDLNCLLWHLEKLISECYHKLEKEELSLSYAIIAKNREKAIQKIFWNSNEGFFFDYNWKDKSLSNKLSLAGIYPLFFKLCTDEQASRSAKIIESTFLKNGGVVTTPYQTGQQWDAPNGWAPLQWMTVRGLLNYGFDTLAKEIALRWTSLNRDVYNRTGKMLEKYNVEDIHLEGGGGEYPVQDGFGWTNGVYLAMTRS